MPISQSGTDNMPIPNILAISIAVAIPSLADTDPNLLLTTYMSNNKSDLLLDPIRLAEFEPHKKGSC
jgi:hypothetical protein